MPPRRDQVLARDRRRNSGKVLETIRARSDIDDVCFLNRLARIASLELCQLRIARTEDLCRAMQNPSALGPRPGGPRALRPLRGFNSRIDFGRARLP